MVSINDLEFICPKCGRKHCIINWVAAYPIDDAWVMENLSEDGKVRISIPYVPCTQDDEDFDCGAEYIVDIETGWVTIYDDRNEIVYEEEYLPQRW